MIIKTDNFFIFANFAFGFITSLIFSFVTDSTFGSIIISTFGTIISYITFIIIDFKIIFFYNKQVKVKVLINFKFYIKKTI